MFKTEIIFVPKQIFRYVILYFLRVLILLLLLLNIILMKLFYFHKLLKWKKDWII